MTDQPNQQSHQGAGPPPPPPPSSGGPAYPPPPPGAPGYGAYGPRSLPPRPRRRDRAPSRILPILLALIALLGFGVVALMYFVSTVLGTGGGSSVRNISLGASQLAMVTIEGPIMPGYMFDFWMDSLNEIAEDEEIEGVIVRLNTPGGSVASSQEIYDLLLEMRAEDKTVYISMGDVAASGGYYIAAAGDRIFANRGTLTGSIGVIATFYRLEEMAEKVGASVEVLKTGRFKDTGSMFRDMSPEEEHIMMLLLNDAYDQFIRDILSQRSGRIETAMMNFDKWDQFLFERPPQPDVEAFMREIADGRVYSGEQAFHLGLVDELGSLDETIDQLAKALDLPEDPDIYEPQRRISFFEALTARVDNVIPKAFSHPTLQYRMMFF